MGCKICKNKYTKKISSHKLLGYEIWHCHKCNYSFVDTSSFSKDKIYQDQIKIVKKFGKNLQRNQEYVSLFKKIKTNDLLQHILEIGTSQNCDFLKRLHLTFKDGITLYSHDIIENKLPHYVTFCKDLSKLQDDKFDVLFCIHTLEHIPSHELISFVNTCKRISKYFVFEVPRCNKLHEVPRSSINPHYSFFSTQSIINLFGKNIYIDLLKDREGIRFTNIKLNKLKG